MCPAMLDSIGGLNCVPSVPWLLHDSTKAMALWTRMGKNHGMLIGLSQCCLHGDCNPPASCKQNQGPFRCLEPSSSHCNLLPCKHPN